MTGLLILLALGLGLALGLALARSREAHRLVAAREEAASATARATELTRQNAELRDRLGQEGDVLQALAPVRTTLAQVGEHVASLEQERTKQFTALSEQLTAARRGEQELRQTTSELAGALRSGTSRGQWGELQLRRILESAGMLRHVDFLEQHSLPGTGARPDVVVQLPDDKRLVIDAKVPFDSYLRATAVGQRDEEEVDKHRQLMAAHAKAVRGHVTELAKRRYHEQLGTSPELVIMFLPSEALLAAALDADPSLLEDALAAGVAPTAPASLLALLRTTASIWAAADVSSDAEALLATGRTLYSRLATVSEHVRRMGRSLETSVGHYNAMVGSLENRLLVTARNFEALDGSELHVEPLPGEKAQVRSMTAPELVDGLGDSDLGQEHGSNHHPTESGGDA